VAEKDASFAHSIAIDHSDTFDRVRVYGARRRSVFSASQKDGTLMRRIRTGLAVLPVGVGKREAELQAALAEQGVETSVSSLWRFFVRRRITLKKSRRTRTSRAAPTS
jgi:hypothetical protein